MYNLTLIVVSIFAVHAAYEHPDMRPEAALPRVATGTIWSILFFDACFFILGPGLEWTASKLLRKSFDWRVLLFGIGLPLGMICQWFSMKLTLTPF